MRDFIRQAISDTRAVAGETLFAADWQTRLSSMLGFLVLAAIVGGLTLCCACF